MIAGYIRPDTGTTRCDGRDITRVRPHGRIRNARLASIQ